MKRFFKYFFIMLLIVLITISSYFIFTQKQKEYQEDIIVEELQELAIGKEEKSEINLQKLYDINSDIVGWIKIDGTNINYPVMQNKKEPEFYLRRNFYKEYSVYGTPFLDNSCDLDTSDNLIIHGHNMMNKKMFGELENYKDNRYFNNHKIIKFYTLDEIEEYEIIAVFKTTLYKQDAFKYYQCVNFSNENKLNYFLDKCNELNFYRIEIDAKYGDKFITLSTCEYSKNNSRLVVVGKLIS